MKKMMPIALCAVLCGCGETRVVDLDDTRDVAQMQNVMELEYRDWTNAAEKMTKSMIASGAFKRTAKPVVAIANIENDTMQRFDTDILTKKIRTTLVNSGTAQVTTAFQNKPAVATAYVPATVKATSASVNVAGASATTVAASGVVPVENAPDGAFFYHVGAWSPSLTIGCSSSHTDRPVSTSVSVSCK